MSAPAPTPTGRLQFAINLGSTTADQSCTSGLGTTVGAALPWLRSRNGACAAGYDRDPSARASFGIYSPETRKTSERGWCDALIVTRERGRIRTRRQDMLPGDWNDFAVA